MSLLYGLFISSAVGKVGRSTNTGVRYPDRSRHYHEFGVWESASLGRPSEGLPLLPRKWKLRLSFRLRSCHDFVRQLGDLLSLMVDID